LSKRGGKMRGLDKLVSVILGIMVLGTGCATFKPSKEVFSNKDINTRIYNASTETCWLALKQTLLKNNFAIEKEENQSQIQATKSFEKKALTVNVVLQVNLQPYENDRTQIFLNATQITKKTYTSRRTTMLLLIPVPTGTDASQTQTEKTIEDEKFYNAFFDQIAAEIKNLTGK